jgi:ATP-dependent RNA helicase DDX1
MSDPPLPPLTLSQVDTLKMEQSIIFCRTNLDCDNLERHLTSLGGGRGFGGKAEKGRENPYS